MATFDLIILAEATLNTSQNHLADAEVMAWLTNRQGEATLFPAMTIYPVGKGIAAAQSARWLQIVQVLKGRRLPDGAPEWGEVL